MSNSNCIFNNYYLEKIIRKEYCKDIHNLNDRLDIIKKWKKGIDEKSIYRYNEKQLQGCFLNDIFYLILDYQNSPFNEEFYLITEQSTILDRSKPDGTIGFFSKNGRDVRAVIELKDANTDLDLKQRRINDIRTPVEQAFSYAPKNGSKCKWIIVSNFVEIRLYHASSQLEYEQFLVTNLIKEKEFLKFYYLLNRNNLINKIKDSVIDELYLSNIENEKNISSKFYKKFKEIRFKLINSILNNNKNIEPIFAVGKAQKILDRIIFICFCRDSPDQLLPFNVLNRIFNPREGLLNTLWEELKILFNAIDIGNSKNNINRYNGGLFKEDLELNMLIIPDEDIKLLKEIAEYNFESELDVNILGHVFEQSISDLEDLKVNLKSSSTLVQENKRKKDGIFYTPQFITKYIVHKAVSKWLEDKKSELGYYNLPVLSEEEKMKIIKIIKKKDGTPKKINSDNSLVSKYIKILKFWEEYREALFKVKIIDISCGSGAFLNQVFSVLYDEGQKVNNIISDLCGGQVKLFIIDNDLYIELDRNILENNIYGIDKNKESVEITKLSLWLKTANKNKTLTSLENNIFLGNSIVSNISIVGSEAFNWDENFDSIMQNGGFDIVIGNPPYIDSEIMTKVMPEVREYCKRRYNSTKGNWDMFIPFIEKGLKILNKNGILSYIVPNKLIGSNYSKEIRRIMSNNRILQFRDYSNISVFKDVNVYPIVFFIQNNSNKIPVKIETFDPNENKWIENIISEDKFYRDIYWDRYFVSNDQTISIIEKMLKYNNLDKFAKVKEALTVTEAYEIKKYLMNKRNITDCSLKFKKLINTGTIDKYKSLWSDKTTTYIKEKYYCPVILESDINLINSKRYEYSCKEKIIVAGMNKELECFYDEGDYIAGKSTTIIFDSNINLKYILGLLNSKLISFFYKHYFKSMALNGGFYRISANKIKQIPIVYEISIEEKLIDIVQDIKKSIELKTDTYLLEKEINDIVYKLYGITQEEKAIVEEFEAKNT